MKYRRRHELEQEILNLMEVRLRWLGVNYWSQTDIAFALGRKPSQHLLNILKDMAGDKVLVMVTVPYRRGAVQQMYLFALPHADTYETLADWELSR